MTEAIINTVDTTASNTAEVVAPEATEKPRDSHQAYAADSQNTTGHLEGSINNTLSQDEAQKAAQGSEGDGYAQPAKATGMPQFDYDCIQKAQGTIYHGTVKQFVAAGLHLNGQKVDPAGLSVLGRYNLLKQVAVKKSARGKPAAVYAIDTSAGGFSLEGKNAE